MDEVEAIARKDIHMKRIDIVRDIFLFCSFTGLAFIDVKELLPENISYDNDGNPWIRISRNILKKVPLQADLNIICARW